MEKLGLPKSQGTLSMSSVPSTHISKRLKRGADQGYPFGQLGSSPQGVQKHRLLTVGSTQTTSPTGCTISPTYNRIKLINGLKWLWVHQIATRVSLALSNEHIGTPFWSFLQTPLAGIEGNLRCGNDIQGRKSASSDTFSEC